MDAVPFIIATKRQHLVGIVQGAVDQDIGFDALEDAKALPLTFVQAIDRLICSAISSTTKPPARCHPLPDGVTRRDQFRCYRASLCKDGWLHHKGGYSQNN
jgi:hypothetical protein